VSKPYKAKSITGAQIRVRQLERLLGKYKDLVNKFDKDRILLAKLAAKTPQFFDPLVAMEAEQLRDRILNSVTPRK
jgi:hypothetical protein